MHLQSIAGTTVATNLNIPESESTMSASYDLLLVRSPKHNTLQSMQGNCYCWKGTNLTNFFFRPLSLIWEHWYMRLNQAKFQACMRVHCKHAWECRKTLHLWNTPAVFSPYLSKCAAKGYCPSTNQFYITTLQWWTFFNATELSIL